MNIGPYSGNITNTFCTAEALALLSEMSSIIQKGNWQKLSNGKDYVIKLPLPLLQKGHDTDVTIKVFSHQNCIKDRYDRQHGSKAQRSFNAALFLQQQGIGTPAPIAWLDRWESGRLVESYYLCLFEPGICFRDALSDIYYKQRDNAPLMDLLHVVAPAIRAMHDAGFMHGDMGNQNILLPQDAQGHWLQPQFIDLNRARYQAQPLDNKARAYDLARIALPGAYLNIFKTIYNNHQAVPAELNQLEQKARDRFWRHRRSGKWRHPIRHLRSKKLPPVKPVYPPVPDIWLWDEKSAQPMIVPGRKEKHAYRNWRYMFAMLWQGIKAAPGIYRRYRKLLAASYQQPIAMHNRIGVALHPHPDYIETELALLKQLGNPPVLLRFCHHETMADWQRGIALVKHLRSQGIEVMLAILQDRRALLEPQSWQDFLTLVIEAVGAEASHIEITHASNRLKWGIWSSDEYAQLMAPALALQKRYPHIKLAGPACIDFEYLPVIAALNTQPKEQPLAALSHLLYVDRRGAPENKQGKYSTLEKTALLKALAQWSDRVSDKVIISEVNWPVKHTGIYSPIGCPYETPRWKEQQPGESDDDYANYMLRFYAITLCSGHAEQVFWWRLSAHGYGLVDDLDNFRPRPAFYALAFFIKLLGEAEFITRRDMPDGAIALEFRRNEQTILMLWQYTQGQFALPDFAYQQAYNREGVLLAQPSISQAPIYLIASSQ